MESRTYDKSLAWKYTKNEKMSTFMLKEDNKMKTQSMNHSLLEDTNPIHIKISQDFNKRV